MSNDIMAVIQLMPGQVGYYDELSRIHLTMGSPRANVYKGTNVSQIRRSVQSGRLRVVNGSLGAEKAPFKVVMKDGKYMLAHNLDNTEKQKKETKTSIKEEKKVIVPVEDIIENPAPIVKENETLKEEATISGVEEITEEKQEEENTKEVTETKKKRASRKKTAKE